MDLILKGYEFNNNALSNSVANFFSHSTSKTITKIRKKIGQLGLRLERASLLNSFGLITMLFIMLSSPCLKMESIRVFPWIFLKLEIWKFLHMVFFYFINWIVAAETIQGRRLFAEIRYSHLWLTSWKLHNIKNISRMTAITTAFHEN